LKAHLRTGTDQQLKERWERFFLLVSILMAGIEQRPYIPPNSPKTGVALLTELRALTKQLKVPDVFVGLASGIETASEMQTDFKPQAYILTLDSEKRSTNTIAFANDKYAGDELLRLEKENIDKPHIQTVMALASSVESLRKAYPSYFADTAQFLNFVETVCSIDDEKIITKKEPAK
jgi:putative GTP pyrophosphokinase